MSKSVKPLRIMGKVPPDYDGPIYYRLAQYIPERRSRTRFRWRDDDAKLERLLYSGHNAGVRVLSSGMVLDEGGNLLPEWTVPLKACYIGTGKPDRLEVSHDTSAWRISERVHDAITALEPDWHLFIPIDVATDVGLERQYLFFLERRHVLKQEIMHPAKMHFKRWKFSNGEVGWSNKRWLQNRDDPHPFGWLDASVVADMHLFTGSSVDNSWVVSSALFERLAAFGDIYPNDLVFSPMGLCRESYEGYKPAFDEPVSAPRPSLLRRLFAGRQ